MEGDFLIRLTTPSPVMHWLLVLLPVTVAVPGLFGAAEGGAGNRRLSLWAIGLALWLFVAPRFADPVAAGVSSLATVLAWAGMVGFWARHVWTYWPSPVWAHAAVVFHLSAIAIASVVALVRAMT
ncbi:hypothetical protein LHP98_01645 [Rhodobacter sp. Har01]|uniref:hypothetical protein n=1 Tax=Rhodobacter sp. Har01 TaxID=2883999 RepID=UPI001D06888C|nr:hypothetical protein [Rhodobacter sp. Har01]MCB6176830.1 hypothetical protein [Rhodobacter sp. Har01]